MIFKKINLAVFAAALLAAAIVFLLPRDAQAIQATLLDDAYILTSKATLKNGSLATIVISPTSKGFVQFDLSTLPAGTVAADVSKANLTLYVTAASVKVAGSISIKAVSAAWDELNITAANAPAIGAT